MDTIYASNIKEHHINSLHQEDTSPTGGQEVIRYQLLLMTPMLLPTFNACRWTAAPGQVPLTGHDVRATDVIPRLALIGQHAASDIGGVG